MTKDSIAIIGFMATGKTTIGKAIADYLGDDYRFIETDQLIVEMAKKSIPRIFIEDGEEKFRNYEINACRKAAKLKNVVISCGGGVVLNKENIKKLKKNCHIVLLKASVEEIFNRIMKNGKRTRPIIHSEDTKKQIERILISRDIFYETAAEITINTENKSIEEIINEIIEKTKIQS
ncbi:MAG: shikimate kinase [Candidatus Hodarchaeota archaeon]